MNDEQSNNNILLNTFTERISSKDVLEFCNDVFPSIALIALMCFSMFLYDQTPCFTQFPRYFSTMTFIYLAFFVRGLIRLLLIYLGVIQETWVKVSFNASDGIFYL